MMEIKSRFALERGVILDLIISDFAVEKGVFFSPRIREKGVFVKLGYKRGIRFGWEWGGRAKSVYMVTDPCPCACMIVLKNLCG